MNILELSHIADKKVSKEDLILFLNNNLSGFILKTHYNYIGCCQSSLDVMQDHLEMAYILEKLLNYSHIDDYERNYDVYPPEITATLLPKEDDIFLLAETLIYVSVLKAKEIDPPTNLMEDINIDIQNFEDTIEQFNFRFSEEIEDYYANYVNAGIYEIASDSEEEEEEYLSTTFDKYPEWQYGFWSNHICGANKDSIYFSSYCWIVQESKDVIPLLTTHSGIKRDFLFDDAILFNNILLNNFTAININSLYSFDRAISFIRTLVHEIDEIYEFQISRNVDIVKITYCGYTIIYFNFNVIKENEIRDLYNNTINLKEKFERLLGISNDISCDWDLLTDELFEELCYDIIYNDIRFNNRTIRKMGKSRSRDGGRDIVVYTNSNNGNVAKKYIIQCKLLKKGSSLAKSKMNNISNILLEYNVDGYMIMTNVPIDSGLYDMLDAFAANPRISVDTKEHYSKYEIERYLAGHANLKSKYF